MGFIIRSAHLFLLVIQVKLVVQVNWAMLLVVGEVVGSPPT
jgi:hypothetical protein